MRAKRDKLLKKKSFEEIQKEEGEEEPLFREIRKEELAREFPLIIYTLEAFLRKGIDLEKKPFIKPLCINKKIRRNNETG